MKLILILALLFIVTFQAPQTPTDDCKGLIGEKLGASWLGVPVDDIIIDFFNDENGSLYVSVSVIIGG